MDKSSCLKIYFLQKDWHVVSDFVKERLLNGLLVLVDDGIAQDCPRDKSSWQNQSKLICPPKPTNLNTT